MLAHIRHVYTDYDQLLKTGEWRDARAAVEHHCLDKLVEWRGDDDGDSDTMSDILREVIVIPDDEEESRPTSWASQNASQANREASVEFIAVQAATETVQSQQLSDGPSDKSYDEALDPDDPEMGVYRAHPSANRQRSDRVEAHRQKTWAEARSRRRRGAQYPIYISSSPLKGDLRTQRRPQSHPHLEYLTPGIRQEAERNTDQIYGLEEVFDSATKRARTPPARQICNRSEVVLQDPFRKRSPISVQVSLLQRFMTLAEEDLPSILASQIAIYRP